MTDRPIIFSAPMIHALLDGRKTQTRRVLKPQPRKTDSGEWYLATPAGFQYLSDPHLMLPYGPGDRLWVREAWAPRGWRRLAATHNDPGPRALAYLGFYRADASTVDGEIARWRPSIHMPRQASRLTLVVTEVRVQRLQDISEADAWAEGCKPGDLNDNGDPFPAEELHPKGGTVGWDCARDWLADLWDSLHGPAAWGANPWVCALTFSVHRCNIDQMDPAP